MTDLEKAAMRIASEYPIEAFGQMEYRSCRHCGRDVEDYMRNMTSFDHTNRRAHEPECSWITLRDALGMDSH